MRQRPTDLNPGEKNVYDKTNDLRLNAVEVKQGWEIVICITCRGRKRRGNNLCGQCRGAGRIKVLDPEKNEDWLRAEAAKRSRVRAHEAVTGKRSHVKK